MPGAPIGIVQISAFRSEATGAAEVVAGRFGGGPINLKYNSKKGGGATIETLDMSLQAAANGMDAENDGRLRYSSSVGLSQE
jgi:hypothetical protein